MWGNLRYGYIIESCSLISGNIVVSWKTFTYLLISIWHQKIFIVEQKWYSQNFDQMLTCGYRYDAWLKLLSQYKYPVLMGRRLLWVYACMWRAHRTVTASVVKYIWPSFVISRGSISLFRSLCESWLKYYYTVEIEGTDELILDRWILNVASEPEDMWIKNRRD